jgi:uncharacterized protein (TIGR03067 family)
MFRVLTCVCVALMLLAASSLAAANEPPKGDLARLQGVWTVVSGERDGKPMAPSRTTGRRVVIRDETFLDESTTKKQTLGRGTLKLDETKSPRWADAAFDFGEIKGKSCKAIYEVDGDTFRTCTGVEGAERPTSFKTQLGTRQMMFVYRRAR